MKAIQKYTEQELVALLKQRDPNAFSYLYDNYAAALNGIVRNFISDDQLADSVLQDSFVKIWNQASTFDSIKGRLFTWMSSIVRNTAIDTLRSKDWKNSRQNVELTDNNSEIAADNALNIDAIGLRKFVGGLRDEYKMVVEMCYFDGFSQSDIAQTTGVPLGTVKTRLRKALLELRSRIKQ
ncbi:RNA polymerase sigma factor [Niabella ginsengisoli]|uniref:Sigma-70 family RNA polymerase sigma factor n=1 Tax=Niabella ginsengisoli TaxID=522298 RepID=A0ABS9SJH1_9BACT|nr:sigma-70 family RNA polymerase sigma factor [Niabella ginsengisoli]MCH5598528.1 sigma-70 family RNA polymerase sigma factor [Niabella ginsengisoli]